MFRYICACTFVVFASAALAPGFVYVPGPVPQDCLKCICDVESNCTIPDPICRLDGCSLSSGPYYIKHAYWMAAQQEGGQLDGDWKICSATFHCSARAVQSYMERYAIYSQLRRQPTCEDFARIHNGGPRGFEKVQTLNYWEKVKDCLD